MTKTIMFIVFLVLYPLLLIAMLLTARKAEKAAQSPISEFIYPMF